MSIVVCPKDRKSAGQEKEHFLEDFHGRFEQAWKVMGQVVLSIRQFQAETNIATQEQPPYSLHLGLCDVSLFSNSRNSRKGLGTVLKDWRPLSELMLMGIPEKSLQ